MVAMAGLIGKVTMSIFLEFNDEHSAEIVIDGLAGIYEKTQDHNLVVGTAQRLNLTVEEVTQGFDALNNSSG